MTLPPHGPPPDPPVYEPPPLLCSLLTLCLADGRAHRRHIAAVARYQAAFAEWARYDHRYNGAVVLRVPGGWIS